MVLFFVVAGAAAFGIYSEHKKWFGKLSGILVTMISMSLLAMAGVVPVASNPNIKVDVYELVFSYFIPISIPMLLFSSNIVKIVKESGKLLVAYILGAIGIVLGCFLAFNIINLGPDSGKTAGVIAATLVGGSVNFIAAAEALNFSTNPLFTATIAVDNFVSNLYTLFLFLTPSLLFLARFFVKPKAENRVEESSAKKAEYPITMERIAVSVFIAAFIAGAGSFVSPYLQSLLNTDINLSILIITVFAVLAANLFPKLLQPLENTAFSVGLWMMYVFLAVIGAATNIQQIFSIGPAVLAFYLTIMVFHFLFLLSLAKLFKLDVYEVVISSAANIMGPSVAAPMAASMGQKKLVTPGILVGILGYVIGTFIGVSIAIYLS
ncbi:putative membrane protein [Marinifilum flexuosum]|uniref:Putative membrane protein n=2 Tax=Marinifilum flexuosum TaxID=1117708 RepID=A0A419XB23_9BACT|nr:putative membrane protein [Marinifilum flexuosum]